MSATMSRMKAGCLVNGPRLLPAARSCSISSPATSQLQSLLKPAANGTAPAPPGKAIDDRYKPLREFVGSGPGAPLDGALKLMNDMQQQLAKLSAAPPGSPPPPPTGEDPAQLL